jgi:hypothetical protein
MPFYDSYVLTDAEWWMKPYILKSEVSGIVGEPGVGKDFWLADVAARATRGWPVPPWMADDALSPEGELPGYVIQCTPEDKPTDTTGHRLLSAGADMSLVYDMSQVKRRKAVAGMQRSAFSIPGDLGLLKRNINMINNGLHPDTGEELKVMAPVTMVILGPLASIATESIAVNQGVRQKIIEPMQALADECGVAMVLSMHFNRGSHSKSTPLIDRINGSMAGIVGSMRCISAILGDDINPDLRRVLTLKNNLAKGDEGEGLEYIISGKDNDTHVRYRPPVPGVDTSSYELLEARVIAWLHDALRPVSSAELAAHMHIPHNMIKQILTKLQQDGILTKRRGAFMLA